MSVKKTEFIETKLLQALETRRSRNDKRLATRAEVRLVVQICTQNRKGFGPWETANLRDLSARGCSVAMKQEMEEGSSFVVQLPGANNIEPPTPLICRVVHCKALRDQTYLIGAEFSGRMPSPMQHAPGEADAEAQRIRRSILL
jgi:hypothetical protein